MNVHSNHHKKYLPPDTISTIRTAHQSTVQFVHSPPSTIRFILTSGGVHSAKFSTRNERGKDGGGCWGDILCPSSVVVGFLHRLGVRLLCCYLLCVGLMFLDPLFDWTMGNLFRILNGINRCFAMLYHDCAHRIGSSSRRLRMRKGWEIGTISYHSVLLASMGIACLMTVPFWCMAPLFFAPCSPHMLIHTLASINDLQTPRNPSPKACWLSWRIVTLVVPKILPNCSFCWLESCLYRLPFSCSCVNLFSWLLGTANSWPSSFTSSQYTVSNGVWSTPWLPAQQEKSVNELYSFLKPQG